MAIKHSLADRLAALAGEMQQQGTSGMEPEEEQVAVKMIFDLKSAAELIDGLGRLLDDMDDLQSGAEGKKIYQSYTRLRELKRKADPEPKFG